MTIEQTIKIAASPLFRRKSFDPVKAEEARKRLCGMCKTDGHELDRFMAEKAAEKALEV
jgi:F0F1-type ATP synthase epsilon subunit